MPVRASRYPIPAVPGERYKSVNVTNIESVRKIIGVTG